MISAAPDGNQGMLTPKFLGVITLKYKQTLPLKDHEVVLTFDDGPLSPYTESTLDTLASQCVKATWSVLPNGRMGHDPDPKAIRLLAGVRSQRLPCSTSAALRPLQYRFGRGASRACGLSG